MGGGGAGGGGGWEAEARLNPPLELFGLAMRSISASHRPKHVQMAKEMSPYRWGEFQTHAFHVIPSMDPIVSVVNLYGWQNSL